MDYTKLKTETEKTSNTKFITLTDEWEKFSFNMTREPEKKVCRWEGGKLIKVENENEGGKNTRVHWWVFTTEDKICSFTEYQFKVFLYSLPDLKNVPDVYTCELKLGVNEKNKPCLKVRGV